MTGWPKRLRELFSFFAHIHTYEAAGHFLRRGLKEQIYRLRVGRQEIYTTYNNKQLY